MKKTILITGGAGFIGINSAEHFLKKGMKVIIFDNFSRKGSKQNSDWLSKRYGKKDLKIVAADIRKDFQKLLKSVNECDFLLHLAGQVAVTTSVVNPREDFEINAFGTLNVLEAVRRSKTKPALIYSSTNKVYGGLDDLKIEEKKTRYTLKKFSKGISEERNLDFHSPYGCSKGAADQYVRDYSRIYGLKTIVFRQSCIYGPHQFGLEDQGWVAWFIIALVKNRKVTIYGDGKQVRDLLYIDDLTRAYELAFKNIKKTNGKIYNIGGGYKNSISIWEEFRPILERLVKQKIIVGYSKWRPGDQPVYISDISRSKKDFNWAPKTSVEKGIASLYKWVSANANIIP